MTQHAPKTFAEVATHLPACLTGIVRGYFESLDRASDKITEAGEYEACMLDTATDTCFLNACRYGYLAIVELMIERGSNEWNDGLAYACRGGHLAIIELMIARGANNWNRGLAEACDGGHLAIVALMIARGANYWNTGLARACEGGHRQIVELMIAYGADAWNQGLAGACTSGHLTIVELMIARGADECKWWCGKSMQDHLPAKV